MLACLSHSHHSLTHLHHFETIKHFIIMQIHVMLCTILSKKIIIGLVSSLHSLMCVEASVFICGHPSPLMYI